MNGVDPGTVAGAVIGSFLCLAVVIVAIVVRKKSKCCQTLRCRCLEDDDQNGKTNEEIKGVTSHEKGTDSFKSKKTETSRTKHSVRYLKFPVMKRTSKGNKSSSLNSNKNQTSPPCIELSAEDEMYEGDEPHVEYDNNVFECDNNTYEDVDEEQEAKNSKKVSKADNPTIEIRCSSRATIDDNYYVTNINTSGVPKLPERATEKKPESDTISDHFYLDIEGEDLSSSCGMQKEMDLVYSYASAEYSKDHRGNVSADDETYCEYNIK